MIQNIYGPAVHTFIKQAFAGVLLIFCLVGCFFRLEGVMGDYLPDDRRSPDEVNYLRYVGQVHQKGFAGYRAAMRNFMQNTKEHIEVPPVRVGYYSLVYLMGLAGSNATGYRPGVMLSLISSLLIVVLTFVLGRRLLGFWPAAVATAFMSVAPTDLIISHRVWQDGYLGLLAMILALLGYQIIQSNKRFVLLTILYGFTVSFGLLSKETFWIYSLCLTIGIIVNLLFQNRQRDVAILVGAYLVALILMIVLSSLVCGGVRQWLLSFEYRKIAHYSNPWVMRNQKAGPLSILYAYTIVSPATSIGMITGGLFCLDGVLAAHRKNGFKAWLHESKKSYLTMLFIVMIIYVAAISIQGTLSNLRFINMIVPIICLLSGYAIWRLYQILRSNVTSPALWRLAGIILVCLMLVSDLRTYEHYFTKHNIGDLMTRLFWIYGYKGIGNI